MRLTFEIWRQKDAQDAGRFARYDLPEVSEHMSFLEMLDVLNQELIGKGEEPVAFDSDCREGICGMCGFVVNGYPHGPQPLTTVCQLHMRHFHDGETLRLEPFRAVRKIGEELQAQAVITGNLLVMGMEENSEITEFLLQVNMLDVETGDLLWSGRTYSDAGTSAGKILGVNQGPSPNEVAVKGVKSLVARLDREFRNSREAEVERMLEATKAQKAAEDAPPAEPGAAQEPQVAPEQEAEEILLQVKPK